MEKVIEQDSIEENENGILEEYQDAKMWLDMLDESEKTYSTWQEKAGNIEKQYADLERLANVSRDREMQMFWANMEVMNPSIYSRPPVPVVASRFKDRKPIKRHAAEILERSLIATYEIDDLHETMKLVRDDLNLTGRGVPWVLRKVEGDIQYLCTVHVNREDFRHGVARTWKEVPWVARRTYETMEDMQERFPEKEAEILKLTFEAQTNGSAEDEKQGDEKTELWELWHKDLGVVVWVCPDSETVMDIQPPEFELQRFFPCPRPAYATLQPNTLIPVPDFLYVKDQLEEINEYTARISALSEALKVKGFYSSGQEDVGTAIEKALQSSDNNAILVPVPNVAALGGAGMDKAITWMPVDKVAAVIVQLVALRKQVIDDVYQVSGISDIMRGSTNANETLGAQQMKSQYGSVRVKDKQEELIRIARDVSRICGEILAENFSADELALLSQYDEIPREAQKQMQLQQAQQQIAQIVQQAQNNPQVMEQAAQNPQMVQKLVQQAEQQIQSIQNQITFEQVVQFLGNEKLRPFSLDIETNSTIQPDENLAKQRTTEFMGVLAQALGQLAPMISSEPQTADFAGQVLKFAVAPFRAGRELDAAIDDLTDNMKKKASKPEKDPQSEQAKAEAMAKQKELQIAEAKEKADAAYKMRDLDVKQKEIEADFNIEQQKINLENKKLAAELGMDGETPAQMLEIILAQLSMLTQKVNVITGEDGGLN